MRDRLVAAFVGLTIVVVALYGIPRAYILADLVREQEQESLDRTAELVATTIGERRDHGDPVGTDYLDAIAADGEAIKLQVGGRTTGTSGWTEPAGADISAEVAVPGGGNVVVARDGERVDDAIADALLPLVVLGLVLVLLSGLVGYLLARRIARPFQDLAAAARGLGAGRLEVDLPDYRVPEAREIAAALESSGQKLGALIQHERDVAVHASHELRTPVTALRLELEDLALWPQTPPDVADQLRGAVGELDRLERAIGELLTTSHGQSASTEIDLDLDALVADTVARLGAGGSSVAHTRAGPMPTHLDPAPLVEALELLLPGADRVACAGRDTHLEVTIAGIAPDRLASRDRASELVAAVGGQISDSPDGLLMRLPRRPLTGTVH